MTLAIILVLALITVAIVAWFYCASERRELGVDALQDRENQVSHGLGAVLLTPHASGDTDA